MIEDPTFIILIMAIIIIGIMEYYLPSLEPPDRVLGVRVNRDFRGSETCRRIVREYRLITVVITALFASLEFLLSLLTSVTLFSVISALTLILLIVFVYLNLIRSRRKVISSRGEVIDSKVRYAVIEVGEERSYRLMKKVSAILMVLPWLLTAVTILIGILDYNKIVATFPIHYYTTELTVPKTILRVLFFPLITLIILAPLTLTELLIYKDIPVINPAYPEEYYRAYKLHQLYSLIIVGVILSVVSLLMSIITLFTWGFIRSIPIASLSTFVPVVVMIISVIPALRVGVEGGRYLRELERKGVLKWEAAMINDDRYWKGGVFYYNPDDHRIIVPKRYGVGYTFNFANKIAILILLSIVLLPLLIVLLSTLIW